MAYLYDKGSSYSSSQIPYYNIDPIEKYARQIINGFNKFKNENFIYEYSGDKQILIRNTIFILNSLQKDYKYHHDLGNIEFLKQVCRRLIEIRGTTCIKIN